MYLPKPSKHAFKTEGDSQTEQEHKASCDINKMIRDVHRGAQVRGSSARLQYGYDDVNLDAVQFRIQKERLERDLAESSKRVELSEEELKHVPPAVQKKFGFKKKAQKQAEPAKNDDKTTKNAEKPEAPTKPESKPSEPS